MKYRIITNGLKFQLQIAENVGECHEILRWHPVTTGGMRTQMTWFGLFPQVEYIGEKIEFDSDTDAYQYVKSQNGEFEWRVL